jgi:hypothetical protein
LLLRGLDATEALFVPIRTAYAWVHQAAHLLENPAGQRVEELRRQYRELLAQMSRERATVGELEPAIAQFLKVTKSYWRGLFHCYEHPEMPRTNNDLEQTFGSVRCHERRATGRKVASPTLVVRGAVRLVASLATHWCEFGAEQLRPENPAALATLRRELGERHEARRAQLRFRRDPASYLARIEQHLIGLDLPP